MATLVRHDSNSTRYSWLWVSHISPKNSKWLQDNLTDMDKMVKAMIKLINEDADSFARRAEMYYKKRPELMKHVEEFYRAYRALAERYDQATGALRQAHRTISEEFPNQMPSMSDESPSSSQEVEPRTPEMQAPLRAPFDPDDLHKDALGVSPQLFALKRHGTHTDEIGSLSSRKGLKQFNDLFSSSDSTHRVSFSDGKVRKGLTFESPDAKGKQDASDDITNLQDEISKLLAESQSLKQHISSESQRADNAESESQSLKDIISCLTSEKDAALLQYSESTKRLSGLETELSKAHNELKKLSDYMAMEVENLHSAESRNNTMQSELETLGQKIMVQEQELAQNREKIESLQDESAKRKQAEDALCTIEKDYTRSQEEASRLALELEAANDRLSEFKQVKLNLDGTVSELKNEVVRLSEQNRVSELLIEELRGDIDCMVDLKNKFESEIHALRSTVSEIKTEKDVALLQHQQFVVQVSDLESKLLKAHSEREKIELKVQMLVQELEQKREEADAIHARLQDEHFNRMQKEEALLAMEDLHSQSQEEAKRLAQDLEHLNKKLSDLENKNFKLHEMSQDFERVILELNFKNNAAFLEQQKSLELVSCLEAQLLVTHSEMEKIVNKSQMLEQELVQMKNQVGDLQSSLHQEEQKCMLSEKTLLRVEHLHLQSQEEAKTLAEDLESLSKKFREAENGRLDLQNISRELENTISEMNSEKNVMLLQQQQSLERISYLEAHLSDVQSDLEKNKEKVQLLEQELKHKEEMMNGLHNNLEEEGHRRMSAEAELTVVRNLHSESEEEVGKLVRDLQKLNDELSEVQDSNLIVEDLLCELMNTISVLNTEKDAALVQLQLSLERVTDLKSEVSETRLEVEKTEHKLQMLEQEFAQKNVLVDILQSSLQDESKKRVEAETLLISNENQYLQSQEEVNRLALEIEMLNRKLNEVENLSFELKNTILLLNSEKDTTLLQYKQSLIKTSDLESKLSGLQIKLENAEQKVQMLDKELEQKREEVDSLETSLKDEVRKHTEGETALLTITNLYSNSQEEVNRLSLEINRLNRKLTEMENMSSELKNSIFLLNSEKDTSLLQHKQSLVRVSDLESKLFEVQDELQNSQQEVQMLDKELKQKREEVDNLHTSLKDEAQKHIKCEASLLVMTNLHSQSQEEVNRSVLKIESLNGKLNEMENSKVDLENMISKHVEDNRILGEQNLSSELTIRGLHDELDMLREMKLNLENEVGLHIGEKGMLQSQLARQKNDNEILEKQYCSLEHEMEALNRKAATLQQLLEEKVCDTEKLSDEYLILKKSFSNAIIETEALKEAVKELEASESSLKYDVSLRSSEKDALGLELHILDKKYSDISEQKSMLETSFSNLNSDLQELRMKLKDSEELSQSYLANNSAILAEQDNILSQLESAKLAMKSLENEHANLGDKHSSLLSEKDLLCSELKNLQDQMEIRNEQHEALLSLHQIQINDFEATVSSLQENIYHMNQMLDQEQQECTHASISALVLNNSLADVQDKNVALFAECQKFIKATHTAEILIARLEDEANLVFCQLESTKLAMKSLENEHADLGDKHSSLLSEKDLLCSQLKNLQDQVEIRNEQHEALLRLHQIQINEFEATVSSLQENIYHMNQMLDQEQQECTHASISALVLNNSLVDVKDKNVALYDECQKFIKATHTAEILIARLEEEAKNEEEEKKALLEHNKKLMHGISQQIKILNICKDLGRPGVVHDEIMLQTLSRETLNHVKHTEESEHRNVFMEAELSVLGTILAQIVIDFRDLHVQKCKLEKEVETGAAKLLFLRNKNHKLIDLNEQLGQTLQQGGEIEATLKIELASAMTQLMQKDDKLHKADERNQFLQEKNQELCSVLRDLEASAEDAKRVKGELEKKIATLTEQGAVRGNDFLLLCEAKVALQGEVDIHKQKEESLMSTLEIATKEAEQHEREIVSLLSDMITCSVNVMIYEEHLLELVMECEALEIRMVTEKGMLMKEISSRDAYIDELHRRIASMGGENAELKEEMSTYLPLVASLSGQISMLEEGTHLLSELDKEGKVEFVQVDKRGSECLDKQSGVLELQSLIARVEALRVLISDAKDRRDEEFSDFAAKLELANLEIQDLKIRKGSCIGHKEQYMEDYRQNYDADNSKGKQPQIMKDIELDQVSTCPPYGTGATVYPIGGDSNAELDDEMLQLWETAEKDCKNQTAKSSSSEHDIQAVEEVKSQYTSFELARGRDLGGDRLDTSTASLEPQQLWTKNVLEKLATDAQGLLIIQASIEEVKQKIEGTSNGKSPSGSEYSSIRAQLQEIEGSVLEQIGFNNSLTKKTESYPEFEASAELEGYSSRRKISEQVQKGSEKVARLDLELQKIQYVLLKLEEEHEYTRVKVSEKRSRLLLRDYVYARKDKNDAGQKKKSRVPFCGCVRPRTITDES
uniref:Uncharacterized protein n=2 Tax=Avena sativa TaxID=4498 RepID=A0ACD5WQW3_AVESA